MSSPCSVRAVLLALALLAALAVLVPTAASAASYGCSFCGHPTCSPWHYSSCPYYGRGLGSSSSGSSGGSYQGSSAAGEALGNALGELIGQAIRDWMDRPQREAAARAARQRQEALAAERERQRQEQLRQERVRLAAQLRDDWDRRDAEIAERLEGVFDIAVPPGPPHSLGAGDLAEEEPALPAPGATGSQPATAAAPAAQQQLEARLRSARCRDVPSPAPQVEIPRDPATGGLASIMLNPLSVLSTQGPLHDALRDVALQATAEVRDHAVIANLRGLGWEMVGDVRDAALELIPGAGPAYTTHSAQTSFAEDLSKALSPELAVALRDGRGLGAHEARLEKAQTDLLRNLASDPSKRQESFFEKWRALLTGTKAE